MCTVNDCRTNYPYYNTEQSGQSCRANNADKWEQCCIRVTLLSGDQLIDVDSGRDSYYRGIPTVHYTFVFNAFVMMILFNEICARKLDASPNVFAGIQRSPLFIIIWLASFIAQVSH